MESADFRAWLASPDTLYELCENPECPYDFAYRFDGSRTHHYHYVGPEPPR